jgi:dTDP-4-dehydrorhamnose 3,5-epimerase
MDGVILTPLQRVYNSKGDIFHGIKKNDSGFCGFGEAYFTSVEFNVVKGWKKHTRMTLNLIVPVGEVKFVIFNGNEFYSVFLSPNNYQRLTITPGLWIGFKGLSNGLNLVLNVANIEHDSTEAINCELDDIKYDWDIL